EQGRESSFAQGREIGKESGFCRRRREPVSRLAVVGPGADSWSKPEHQESDGCRNTHSCSHFPQGEDVSADESEPAQDKHHLYPHRVVYELNRSQEPPRLARAIYHPT